MKNKLAWLLILTLVLSTGIVFADDEVVTDGSEIEATETDDGDETEATETEEDDESSEPNGKGKGLTKNADKKLKNEVKKKFNLEKELIEENKDLIEKELEDLKADYEVLVAAGDIVGAEALLPEIEELDQQFQELKYEMKLMIMERKVFAESQYTKEELETFNEATFNIREIYSEAEVLELGSVVLKKNVIKFDTPPYVKNGRTVVPVRALTEGLGANVSFDGETRQVTISNPLTGTEIVLILGSTEALVNGEVVILDSMAEITNSRTYVPIRFIAEVFGLNVEWDAENKVIDIEEDTEETDDGTGSDDATETDDGTKIDDGTGGGI